MTISDVVTYLKKFAPLSLAESWDNVGLLLGDSATLVTRVMTCLTITPEVVDEAIRDQVQLIVSHHPVLFKPTHRLTTDSYEGRLLWDLCRAGVAIYSPHTAYDNCPGGINEQLAESLQLQNVRPVMRRPGNSRFKIVVFLPEADLSRVSQALFDAGAGVIGQYRECSFRVAGTGTFFGETGSQPTVGQAGRREEVAEFRLDVVCPQERLSTALQAMINAHSYEEPAFDVYPLHAPMGDTGAGRAGELQAPLSAQELGQRVAAALGIPSITLTGARDRNSIRSLAIVCGAGGSMLGDVIAAGADAFLTGELRFHDELAARQANVTAIVAGHYATERPGVESLAARLSQVFPSLRVWASRSEGNPAVVINR